MYKIIDKQILNTSVTQLTVLAPAVAHKAKAGQFVVLRIDEKGERIPLTVCECDSAAGTVTVIFQVVGNTTIKLNSLNTDDVLCDFVGPLGKPTEINATHKRVCVIGGGVGSAIAYAEAKACKSVGVTTDLICGFRSKDLVIMESRLQKACDNLYLMTDDGSYGEKGFVTTKLSQLIEQGVQYDEVFAVGPIVMMRAVCKVTNSLGIPTIVSLNPIMVDGIGMCGGCRVTVDGQVKFACVDGPDFDGAKVDFDNLIKRNSTYDKDNKTSRHNCNLTGENK